MYNNIFNEIISITIYIKKKVEINLKKKEFYIVEQFLNCTKDLNI